MFHIKNKATGEITRPLKEGVLMNPENGALYQRGMNITDEFELVPMDKTTQEMVDSNKMVEHKNYSICFDSIIENMRLVKGGALKALIIIYSKTIFKKRAGAVITNEEFIETGGTHLARRDYVISACNILVELNLIKKQQFDAYHFWYTPLFTTGEANGDNKEPIKK